MQGTPGGHRDAYDVPSAPSGNTPLYGSRDRQTHGEIMETLSLRRDLSRPENPPFGMWWTYTVEETLLWPILDYHGSVNTSLDAIMLYLHSDSDDEEDDENRENGKDGTRRPPGREPLRPRASQHQLYKTQSFDRRGLDDGTVIPELIESFLKHVHTKSPILDPTVLRSQAESVIENGIGWDAASCQVLLACALGAISGPWNTDDLTDYARRKPSANKYALAREYFAAGQKRLGPLFTRSSLIAGQCLFMAGTYYMYVQKPVSGWRLFNAASITCRTYISKRLARESIEMRPLNSRSIEQRLCWSCFKAEREVACEFGMETYSLNVIAYSTSLPTPPNGYAHGMQQASLSPEAADEMGWGRSVSTPAAARCETYEDESWYFFLTDIVLRKLEMRIDTYSQDKRREAYRRAGTSPEGFFGSLLEALQEFDYQLTCYYKSLPPAMRFPLDDMTLCPNELRQYLRWRFLSVRHDICLPALYILIHNDVSQWPTAKVSGLVDLANACLSIDIALLEMARMTHRHHGTWLMLRKGVRSALILVAARKLQDQHRPELNNLQVPDDRTCKAGLIQFERAKVLLQPDCNGRKWLESNFVQEFSNALLRMFRYPSANSGHKVSAAKNLSTMSVIERKLARPVKGDAWLLSLSLRRPPSAAAIINANVPIMVTIDRVQFEHRQNAIGINETEPRISWRFCDNEGVAGWLQAAYQIEVTKAGSSETQSYLVKSSSSNLVAWPSQPLKSGEGASVRVRAFRCSNSTSRNEFLDADATPWSEPVDVEAGLTQKTDWDGSSMIMSAAVIDKSLPKQPQLFRRIFSVKGGAIRKARLYITAHGIYEAHINGARVGDETIDVTSLIQQGQNAIAVQVAEGWFSGRLGFGGGIRNIWGDEIGFAAKLVIEANDSTRIIINTDTNWKSNTGSLITAEIYDGEVCDLSLEPKNWRTTACDDTAWTPVVAKALPSAALVAPDGPPVRVVDTLAAASSFLTPSGKLVVDFAQNIVGWVRIRLEGPKGHIVKLVYTEELEDGEIATRPLRICKATDTIILSGETQTWEPKFTFHGFRYVQIEGLSYMEQTGWFECSNPLLNQLHKNIQWGMRGNFLSIPTDCPQRDERLGWTGDIHVFGPTAGYLYDVSGMLQGWLKDLAHEQLRDHGSCPPFFCPDVPVDDTRYPTAIWGDVTIGLPWSLYNIYGDEKILDQQMESMQTWLHKGIPRDEVTGLWANDSYQFGDWLDPMAPPDDPGNSITDPQLVANAYLVHVTRLMEKTCLALGLGGLADQYAKTAVSLKAAFQKRYITAEGRVVADSQTALALCIYFDLFEGSNQEKVAASRLKHLILRNSRFKIATGFAGTPIIGHALSHVGETQLFYRMLYHRKLPSWLYQVTMGATTMWERWDSKLPDGSINPGEMTSFNHYALGAVAHWMHGNIGGLVLLEPGWRRFRVAPVPGGDLRHATAEFLSPYGRISAKWKLIDDSETKNTQFCLSVRVPPNTSAEVILPPQACATGQDSQLAIEVTSGFHEFRCEYIHPQWPPLPLYPQFYPHDDDEP
ncbi:hypothetical protein HJFPF1_02244 [Paramyrothecium foliicola]|nr:hypothetical protein HJFPF1_02244 [Paramyrothecium foliicola]